MEPIQPVQLILLAHDQVDHRLTLYELARSINRLRIQDRRILVVHGRGTRAAQELEIRGLERDDVAFSDMDRVNRNIVLDRAIRESNRSIVSAFTDAGIPTVGWQGFDKGLLVPGDENTIEVRPECGVLELVRRGVVVVISTLIKHLKTFDEVPEEVSSGQVISGLGLGISRILPVHCLVIFPGGITNFISNGKMPEEITVEALTDRGFLTLYNDIKGIIDTGLPVFLTSSTPFQVDKIGSVIRVVT